MENKFLDLDLKFRPHPFKNSVANISGSLAINRALTHLFFTRQGEKLYDNDYGIGIQDRIFEMNNFLAKDSLLTFVKSQINNYEPRINLINFEIQQERDNMTLNLEYSLKSNPQQILSYQKTIKRLR